MGNLILNFGVMGSSKTANLMQEVYNLEHSKKKVLLIKPLVDTKGDNNIHSRFGGKFYRPVDVLVAADKTIIENCFEQNKNILKYDFIVVDEAQFLTEQQAHELWLLSKMKIKYEEEGKRKEKDLQIICYSLFTNFKGMFFPGSRVLLSKADEKNELTRRCEECGIKVARFNARKVDGKFVIEGDEVVIDNKPKEVQYVSLCGECYYENAYSHDCDNHSVYLEIKKLSLTKE